MKIKNRLLSGMLALFLMTGSVCMCANATDLNEIPADEVDGVYYQAVDSNELEGFPEGPHIYSESGIVMDIDSGAILYAKNIDDRHYPASITKIATALIAFQNYELDETLTFTWDDIRFLEYGDAHIGIKPDETISMEDALYGMLLASANEVSHAIGAHMEGGYEAFLEEMNRVTAELGCMNSNWMNTHGLHHEEHYTSARDMALIGSAVFQYEKFREITGTYQHIIGETNITNEKRYVHQNHKMIRKGDNRYYEYCVGGKTGYTDQALSTLVTFATKDDMNLVAVVLRTHGGGNNAYADTREMLDYAFENFTKVPVSKDLVANDTIQKFEDSAYVVLPEGIGTDRLVYSYKEPTEFGDKTGTVTFTYGGQEVGTVETTITVKRYNEMHGITEGKKDVKEEKKGMPIFLKIILIILAVIAVAIITLICYVSYKRKQLEKARRERRRQYREQRDI